MSTKEADRKDILRQMKVRTTYKKDKSWIHQQNSEDERDENPISPQRKSFEGNKVLWSPTPDSKSERNSGTFTAREVFTSSSPPVHSNNKQFSYTSSETNKSTSTTSQASPPQTTSGAKVTPSYIIRGQPFNAVSQVKNPPSYNGYQKSYSTIQPRTSASLPRVPNATGHKMSTEEYKKLAPYNVRSRSVDLSDDEAEEQPIDTEQNNRIMKSTPQRDRSYVLSAAKRTNGSSPQEATSPLMAKKVQIEEEETSPNRKSQTLPKTLSSYLHDDHKKIENNLKETPSKETTSQTTSQTSSQTAPSGTVTDGSSGPQLTSYSTGNVVESKNSTITPGPARITVVREERNNNDKNISKPAAERQLPTSPLTTRKERVEITNPESLASYLYDDTTRLEKSWKANQATKSTSQTVSTSINNENPVSRPAADRPLPTSPLTTRKESNNNEKYVSKPAAERQLPTSPLTTRKESNNNEKYVSKPAAERQLPTSPLTTRKERVEITNPESLASYLYDDTTRLEKSWKANQAAKSTSQTVSTSINNENPVSRPAAERPLPTSPLTTRKESNNNDKYVSKPAAERPLPTSPLTTRKESATDNSKVTSRSSEITTTTTRAKVTIETLTDSTAPKAAPRMETKPKEAAPAKASYKQEDLISWSDLDNNTNSRTAKSVTPASVPPQATTDRPNQPTKPGLITIEEETRDNKARYRVTESLDDPEFDVINNQSASENQRVTIVETPTERPRTPEPRSSSPRPTPRPRESIKTTVTESRYRVPDTLDDTMLEASPSRSSSRTTVTTTRNKDPVYSDYMEGPDGRSTRTVTSSRETITTTTEERGRGYSSSAEASQYDPQASNKGVLFVKEYVNSRESLKSPTSSGSFPDFSDDSERLSYSTSSSYLYSSPPERSDEGPCSYCGRPIKDCPKIILEHLNIHCHEYCFKCGICNKPMGDLVDSLFIHRDVVHCESCYEKLF